MRLSELLAGITGAPEGDPEIEGLALDSRKAGRGDLFFCVPGSEADGHDFAPAAAEAGAAALVCERELELALPQVVVPDVRAAMGPIANRFFGSPSRSLELVGITGTNGKTTTAYLTRAILEAEGIRCGMLGTVTKIIGGAEVPAARTTAEAVDLQRDLAAMREGGDVACVMEVSSHALTLKRTGGTRFAIAAFTNLTPEHLDFHPDMDSYYAAKRELFFADPRPRSAIVNVDDEWGRRLAAELSAAGVEVSSYSARGSDASLRAADVRFDASGATFTLINDDQRSEASIVLPGEFNVANALCAIACAGGVGIEPARAVEALRTALGAPGRFEPVDEGQPFTVLVDYAHTPDSLENILAAARELTGGELIVVFGAGGDRDRAKRPEMGRIAAASADSAIVTSDNPRNEDPEAIIAEIVAGIDGAPAAIEPDRRAAIELAVGRAGPGDVIVIAGKGHEQGQEFEGGRKQPFDDVSVARQALRSAAGAEGG